MKRCIYCNHRIWPWQRLGWFVTDRGIIGTWYWHPGCRRKAGIR